MNSHRSAARSAKADQNTGVPHALAHSPKDNVAVVVIEGFKAGTEALIVVTEDNTSYTVTAKDDIPIGHKLALTDLSEGDTVIKYGQDVGRMVGQASKGRHVHTHNMKTKRW
jgi:(2R)-sulfolactate sulfo-lyase subunit alpha